MFVQKEFTYQFSINVKRRTNIFWSIRRHLSGFLLSPLSSVHLKVLFYWTETLLNFSSCFFLLLSRRHLSGIWEVFLLSPSSFEHLRGAQSISSHTKVSSAQQSIIFQLEHHHLHFACDQFHLPGMMFVWILMIKCMKGYLNQCKCTNKPLFGLGYYI